MKKVYFGGGMYGCSNIGDESIVYNTLETFDDVFEFTIATNGSEWIEKKYPSYVRRKIALDFYKPKFGISMVPRKRFLENLILKEKEKKYLRTMDGYICGGGTILSDCPWFAMNYVRMAGNSGIPVILWGSGMSDDNDSQTNAFIADTLNKDYVRHIFVRDSFVKSRLVEIGVAKQKLDICYDPAINTTPTTDSLNELLAEDQLSIINNGRKTIGVSISGENDVIKRTPIGEIQKALRVFSTQYNLAFIPTSFGKSIKDLTIANQLADELGDRNAFVIAKELEANQLVTILSKMHITISSRLHVNIFSACAGLPTIGLARNCKTSDFCQLVSMPFIDIENTTSNYLVETVNKIESGYEKYKNCIISERDIMRTQYRISSEMVKKVWLH